MSFLTHWFKKIFELFSLLKSKPKTITNYHTINLDKPDVKSYYRRWETLLASITASIHDRVFPIEFSEIPWPILPALAKSDPDPLIITRENLTRFLICPYSDDKKSCLEKVMNEIERWNDFELMVAVNRNVYRRDKKKVQEAWSRVVLVLMEMRGDYAS